MESLFSGLFGALFVFILDLVYWRNRQKLRRVNGNLNALLAEINYCGEMAEGFLNDIVKSPLYRLPHIVYENALPELVSEGAISPEQVSRWLKFYQVVETLNRGFDLAAECRNRNDVAALNQEHDRNRLKARKLAKPGGGMYKTAAEHAEKTFNWWQV